MMPKRAYPRKAEDERRIVVSFSLSGDLLKDLRARMEQHWHRPPTKADLQMYARSCAYKKLEEILYKNDLTGRDI